MKAHPRPRPTTAGWPRAAAVALVTVLSLGAAGAGDDARPAAVSEPTLSPAAAFFERLKSLDGDWKGESTRGWTDRVNYRTIAAGSVVMSISFEAHPGETMVTMYHLDGDRLLVTHYCVAKNQPRLQATEFSPDGRTATFTFLDGTGMASRETGHMDKMIMTFEDAGTFTSHWTWYQNGSERWMEEIRHVRER